MAQVQAGERIVIRVRMQTPGMRLPRVRHWHDLANGEYFGQRPHHWRALAPGASLFSAFHGTTAMLSPP